MVRTKVTTFCSHISTRWKSVDSTESTFIKKYENWLNTEILFPEFQPTSAKIGAKRGRPRKDFTKASTITRRRSLRKLQTEVTKDELVFAAKTALYRERNIAAAQILEECTQTTPTRASKIRNIVKKSRLNPIVQYTPNEALAFLLDSDMTRDAYIQTRLGAKIRNADIYPSYEKVKEAKKLCYPEGIAVSNTGATVPIQALLHKTISRLLEYVNIPPSIKDLKLICKWGCDGSSGYTKFMHKPPAEVPEEEFSDIEEEFSDNEEDYYYSFANEDMVQTNTTTDGDEANLFLMSCVALRLVGNSETEPVVIWENHQASSTNWCRPIQILYKRETSELTVEVIKDTENEIKNLEPFISENIVCKFEMYLTMVNGKAISALTKVPSMNCHICLCKPSEMNNLNFETRNVKPDNLKYGLTTMHAWMKFMECILHISYYLELKRPTKARASKAELDVIQKRKADIQEKLHTELGIYVDRVVQGKGTSNTGNTGRIFLRNYEIVAKITEIDENLIKRFYLIMVALASGRPLQLENFEKYTRETAELYVSKYNWYRMPVSIHKILVHGAVTAKHLVLPIGLMSEEAQESSNKIYRRVRERHTRKNLLSNVTEDLMKRMLLLSDPVITNIRLSNKKQKHEELPEEVHQLVIIDKDDADVLNF